MSTPSSTLNEQIEKDLKESMDSAKKQVHEDNKDLSRYEVLVKYTNMLFDALVHQKERFARSADGQYLDDSLYCETLVTAYSNALRHIIVSHSAPHSRETVMNNIHNAFIKSLSDEPDCGQTKEEYDQKIEEKLKEKERKIILKKESDKKIHLEGEDGVLVNKDSKIILN